MPDPRRQARSPKERERAKGRTIQRIMQHATRAVDGEFDVLYIKIHDGGCEATIDTASLTRGLSSDARRGG